MFRSVAMGQTVSDETKHQKAWDSNAITPGTPFMDLLASCLRYWVTDKINTDPGWKNVGYRFSELYFAVYMYLNIVHSFKSYFQMPVYLVKENIKSWISSADRGLIRIMTQIRGMLFMDW